MAGDRGAGKIVMQVTISAEDAPALFNALVAIREPKRRVGRLKGLAGQGLAFERGAAVLVPAPRDESDRAPMLAPAGTVSTMLDWASGDLE